MEEVREAGFPLGGAPLFHCTCHQRIAKISQCSPLKDGTSQEKLGWSNERIPESETCARPLTRSAMPGISKVENIRGSIALSVYCRSTTPAPHRKSHGGKFDKKKGRPIPSICIQRVPMLSHTSGHSDTFVIRTAPRRVCRVSSFHVPMEQHRALASSNVHTPLSTRTTSTILSMSR